MKSKCFRIAAVALVIGVAAIGAHAQEKKKGTNRGAAGAASPGASAVEGLRTAASLIRYGDASKDPLALIAAARIMRAAGGSESKTQRVSGTEGAKDKPDAMAFDAVLGRAKALSAGRPDLIALADDLARPGTRGAVDGPGRRTTVVNGHMTDVFRVTFRGHEPARILVSGDGDSDLDLYVTDENGNTVCKDDDDTDDMVCFFTPRWTGTFSIRVKNLGVANRYTITHN